MTAFLSSHAFHRARAFVEEKGRPLDASILRYHLGSGSAEAVTSRRHRGLSEP